MQREKELLHLHKNLKYSNVQNTFEGDNTVDELIQLEKKRETCAFELTVKEADLRVKKNDLENLKLNLEMYITDRERLKFKEQEIKKKIHTVEDKILKYENYIKKIERVNDSLQSELAGVFAFSLRKKKELRTQIEINEKRVFDVRERIDILELKKSEFEKSRQDSALNAAEIRVNHLQKSIDSVSEEIRNLETQIFEINTAVTTVEEEIRKKKEAICVKKREQEASEATKDGISEDNKPEEIDSLEVVEGDMASFSRVSNVISDELCQKCDNMLFYYKKQDIDAIGYQDNEIGFVIKKGSRISAIEKITCSSVTKRLRKEYAYCIDSSNILKEDIIFKSANQAANFCVFGTASATLVWTTEDGVTLRDYRKELNCVENNPVVEQGCLEDEVGIEQEQQSCEEKIFVKNYEVDVFEEEELDSVETEVGTDTPYYQLYGVNPNDYSELTVESLEFSVRLYNILSRNGFEKVEELLKTNDDVLCKIKGFGKTCLDELHAYLGTLPSCHITKSNKEDADIRITAELVPFREQILCGDFSFLNDISVSFASMHYINQFRKAYSVLDSELIEQVINGNPEVFHISEMLQEFIRRMNNERQCKKMIQSIPNNRLDTNISLIIKCFSDNEAAVCYLKGLTAETEQSLREYLLANADMIRSNEKWLTRLMKWCEFDLCTDFNHFFGDMRKSDRELQVIRGRSEGKTLEVIGSSMGITRERVRQIEKKIIRRFDSWQKHNRVLFKIFLDMNEKTSLSSMEIINFLGCYGQEFVYLMKNCVSDDVIYDKQFDMFIMEDVSLTEKVQSYVDTLPDAFSEKKLTDFLKKVEKEDEYPVKMVMAAIEDNYQKTGDTYHRFRLSLASIYSDVLQRFYPNGIHVYDAVEIEHFRRLVHSEYGMDLSNKSDHAIGAVLSRIGILCGRGIYMLRQDKTYISEDLARRIHDYIESSASPIFMTNTLFSIFEDDLLSEGVDNKYFLQGILRDLYENEWIFRRDYISKDESYTSVYSSIIGFIRNSQYPISKEELHKEFPGVTEIVISISVSDPNILNLFGHYIHSCRLKLSASDIRYLKDTIERFLSEKDVCHCKEIYEYINADYPVVLTNNFVYYAFSLYSLLEYLFRDHYNFSRPFVARENATIERVADVLRDIVRESERMEISEIQTFAREHRFQLYNICEFIDSCNDTHLLISDMEIASINYIGVTEEMAKAIESIVASEIEGTMPIYQLQTLHSLPQINVEWNAWLIYSVLKKWSTRLEVGLSSSQFRQSYPVVSPIGKLDMTAVGDCSGHHEGTITMADDLSKIDDLIGNYVLEDLEDLNGL